MPNLELLPGLAADPVAAQAFCDKVRDAAIEHRLTNGQFVVCLCSALLNDACMAADEKSAVAFLRITLRGTLHMLDELMPKAAPAEPIEAHPAVRLADKIVKLFVESAATKVDAVDALGVCLLNALRAGELPVRRAVRVVATTLLGIADAN